MPYRPQKFHCRSKIPFLGICRGEPYLANKISGIHLGRKKKTCIFLARGKVQNHGIYSSRRPPPSEIPLQQGSVSGYLAVASLQRPGAGVRRGHMRFDF